MLKNVRKWIFGSAVPDSWRQVQAWCEEQGVPLRPTHAQDGFALTLHPAASAVRVEWGPSQRRYLRGAELRLRAESGVDPEVYAALMPRPWMDRLEAELFDRITDGTQTHADDSSPEEVRWLALSPRLTGNRLGPLAAAWGAVGNAPEGLSAWLTSGLAEPLQAWQDAVLSAGINAMAPEAANPPALVWVAQRGRMTLRLPMAAPNVAGIAAAVALFEQGLAKAHLLGAAPDGHSLAPSELPDGG